MRSAFKQRHRWVFGVLQGLALSSRSPLFTNLPRRARWRVLFGTRLRILTFAMGALVGALSMLYMPLVLARELLAFNGSPQVQAPWPVTAWLSLVGMSWLGAVVIGAWLNVQEAGLSRGHRAVEIARAVAVAPVAGLIESSAGLWALAQWTMGHREVFWQPTPKTRAADDAATFKPDTAPEQWIPEAGAPQPAGRQDQRQDGPVWPDLGAAVRLPATPAATRRMLTGTQSSMTTDAAHRPTKALVQ